MANPQPEPFVQFSKELFDAILRSRMPGTHKEIVLAVVRRTYGDFGRKAAPISLSLLHAILGRDKRHMQRCLAELKAEGVIAEVEPATFHNPQVIGLNKDYETWGRYSVSPDGVDAVTAQTPPGGAHATPTGGEIPLLQVAPTPPLQVAPTPPIEDKRDIETRETPPVVPHDRFDEFWILWPNRHGNKELAGHRFKALSAKDQAAVLRAESHFVAAVAAGRYDLEYQPAAENFVGGRKHYYTQWVDGPPAKYARQGKYTPASLAAEALAEMELL